jgi:hypothetical protein
MKIERKNVEWSVLRTVQKFLVGGKDDPDTIEDFKQGMVENMVVLCNLQAMYGLDAETCSKFNKVLCNCSDVYEFLKSVSEEMDEELICR